VIAGAQGNAPEGGNRLPAHNSSQQITTITTMHPSVKKSLLSHSAVD